MKRVLVDSSVWISYLRNRNAHEKLDELISNNQICTNNLILSELIPFLKVRNQTDIIESLLVLPNIPLAIDWQQIINLQIQNLRNGINRVGIPDLILVDNVANNNLILFSEDKHFSLMKKHYSFDLIGLN